MGIPGIAKERNEQEVLARGVLMNSDGTFVNPPSLENQETQLVNETNILNEIRSAIQGIATARGISADLRITVVGGTLPVVTTLSLLTNQAQIGGYLAGPVVPSAMNNLAIQSNINNVGAV